MFIASGNGVTVEYIIDKGSACVEAFRDISHLVAHFFGNPDRSRRSKEVSFTEDLRVLVEHMESPAVALHKQFQERLVKPIMVGKKKKKPSGIDDNSAVFDIIDAGLSTWGGSFNEYIRSTTYDPAVGYPIEDFSTMPRDTRLDNGTVFDNLNENPLSTDEYHDTHCDDEEGGGLGGGGEFYTGDEVEL